MLGAAVSRAIEDVYVAFASEPKPRTIDACPHCVDHREIRALLSTPLRELSSEQLAPYASSVFLTAGSESDFRYFLPRILEISVTDRHWYPNLEIVLGNLTRASWHLWPEERINRLNALFDAAFGAAIQDREGTGLQIDDWVCALALARADVNAFLERLLRSDSASALVEFYDQNSQDLLLKGKLANAFWSDHPKEMEPVVVWLKSPAVVAAVERARSGQSNDG